MSLIFNSLAMEGLSDAALEWLRFALFQMLGSARLTEADCQVLRTALARIENILRARREFHPPEGPAP
ncbi:hypothetical protein BYZ73_00450 [Rhodovulum viride]|uniref:Uncharacterized protein n=1 Tax=Rhodovulum viride TaxID=1231134 RepID=A0ABX9DLK3_9RHOB|nr:hypothetical protein [Rhodovulum viride]RAP43216.1 hypothetical protein BYZ73_00450 [Rhodovulum viride]